MGETNKLEVSTSTIKTLHLEFTTEENTTKKQLDPENDKSDVSLLAAAKQKITKLQNQLDAPTRRYQEFLTAQKEWRDTVARLENNNEDSDSIVNLSGKLKRISELPSQIAELENQRLAKCRPFTNKSLSSKITTENYITLFKTSLSNTRH